MNDLVHHAVRESMLANLRDLRESVLLLPLLRKDVASNGPAWLPLVLVLGAIGAVAYADHRVVSISLVYLYILPVGVGAIFLRKEVSYSIIVICILLHDSYSRRPIHPALRIFDNLSAVLPIRIRSPSFGKSICILKDTVNALTAIPFTGLFARQPPHSISVPCQ